MIVANEFVYIAVMRATSQQRSYHSGHARSLQHSDAKLGRAELVLRWGTTRESSVLLFFVILLPFMRGLLFCFYPVQGAGQASFGDHEPARSLIKHSIT